MLNNEICLEVLGLTSSAVLEGLERCLTGARGEGYRERAQKALQGLLGPALVPDYRDMARRPLAVERALADLVNSPTDKNIRNAKLLFGEWGDTLPDLEKMRAGAVLSYSEYTIQSFDNGLVFQAAIDGLSDAVQRLYEALTTGTDSTIVGASYDVQMARCMVMDLLHGFYRRCGRECSQSVEDILQCYRAMNLLPFLEGGKDA